MSKKQQIEAAVAVINAKGGVGKTTATLSLARAARMDGQDVGVIDYDLQGLAALYAPKCELPVYTHEGQLGGGVVFIDTPRIDHAQTHRAAKMANAFVIPVRPHVMDLRSSESTALYAAGTGRPVFWLPSMIDERRTSDRELGEALRGLMARVAAQVRRPIAWPILPPLRQRVKQAYFIKGQPGGDFEDDARACWTALRKGLRA